MSGGNGIPSGYHLVSEDAHAVYEDDDGNEYEVTIHMKPNDSKEPKESDDSKGHKESDDSKESKESKESKHSNGPNGPNDSKESKHSNGPNGPNDSKESKHSNGPNGPNGPNDSKESKDSKKHPQSSDSKKKPGLAPETPEKTDTSDIKPKDSKKDTYDPDNFYLDGSQKDGKKDVYEKNPATGDYKKVGSLDPDGKTFTRDSDPDIIKENYGGKPLSKSDAPTGYNFDSTKSPMIDDNGDIWQQDPNGKEIKVGHKKDDGSAKGTYQPLAPKQVVQENYGAKPVTTDSAPTNYDMKAAKDQGKDPQSDGKNIYEYNPDTRSYEKAGTIGQDNKYTPLTPEQRVTQNYNAKEITSTDAPKGYSTTAGTHANHKPMSDGKHVYEYNDAKGGYEKVADVDSNKVPHYTKSAAADPDPTKLTKGSEVPDASNIKNHDKFDANTYVDPKTNDVYEKKGNDYELAGHIKDDGKGKKEYVPYSPDDVLRKNHGATAMDKSSAPTGYTYDADKSPQVDADKNVWELNQSGNAYVKVGHIDTNNKYVKDSTS
jgi:hypothetical protein